MRVSTIIASALFGLVTIACQDEPRITSATLTMRAHIPGAQSACFMIGLDPAVPVRVCGALVDGVFASEVSAACADEADHLRAVVRLVSTLPDEPLAWRDPCGASGCAFEVACGQAARAELSFANEETRADFTATQVYLPSRTEAGGVGLALGARWSTCDADGVPLELIADDAGEHRASALVAFAGAGAADAVVVATTPIVTCGDAVRCPLSLAEADGVTAAACGDGSTIHFELHRGIEALFGDWWHQSLTVVIDVDDLIDAGHTDCTLEHAATISAAPLVVGPLDTYPVASFHARILDANGEIACDDVSFDDYGHEDADVLAVDFVRGVGLAPADDEASDGGWTEVAPLCNRLSGTTIASTCE